MLPHIDLDMLRSLATEREFGRFFELAASAAARIVGADGAALIQCIDGDQLEYCFFQGLPREYERLAHGYAFAADQGTAGMALRQGQPIFTPDYPASPNAMPAFAAAGLRANLVVPVGPADDRRGALAISWFSAMPAAAPSDAELSIVLLIADLIYGAMYRQSLERDLAQQARHDALTGLPNRRHLFETLQEALGQARAAGEGLAVLVLDLNGFKQVNDVYGHEAGDRVLGQLARRLRAAVRDCDMAARLGGDEFAVLLRHVPDRAGLAGLLERLREALDRRYLLDGDTPVSCPSSIGATLFPQDADDPETLLRHADAAMYAAKARAEGHGAWEMHGGEGGSASAPARLPGAVELHFQPILDMPRGRVTRLEALMRIRRDGRLRMPPEILPSLNTRQKSRLFDEVLEQALDALADWDRAGQARLGVSVNVEPETLADPRIARRVADALDGAGIAPQRLTLEILERGEFLSQDIARAQLGELHRLGVRLAIDDLGSGYSSLQRLRNLPIDEIKLDQTFVRELGTHLHDIAFLQSVRDLAGFLHVRLVVEGAESPAVLGILRILGIDEAQGWAVARPRPAADVPATLRELQGWRAPDDDGLATVYARQLALESHLLGVLGLGPGHIDAEHLRRHAGAPIGDALRELPEALALHRRQMAILHDMARHPEADQRLPAQRCRSIGHQLRALLADAAAV